MAFLEQIEAKQEKLMERADERRRLIRMAKVDFALQDQDSASGAEQLTLGMKLPKEMHVRLKKIKESHNLKTKADAARLALNAGCRLLNETNSE